MQKCKLLLLLFKAAAIHLQATELLVVDNTISCGLAEISMVLGNTH